MSVSEILAEVRKLEDAMREPGADCDTLRAKKTTLLTELSESMRGIQASHTPVVDERLIAYCDSLLQEFSDNSTYVDFAADIRNSAGTVYQEAIHDKLVKLYGPTIGADLVSDTYRKVTAGV